ncbi:DoxX family protein [Paludisphaera mucosa]|uniref:DoxX family protein n=1 Tax=Paludisphaera mucosa TaxID=3030827 RepID=A0ABT6F5T8_9BACT|nr:DoxX family protein [Paludisphaera mucosa]MDG3002948.1 DoxX family protein [Paludisphaera mucosa]
MPGDERERRRPLNAARRYQIGFLGALFLVLLRVAIGWHFLTEGVKKYEAGEHGKPFSAEIYLKNANGPFAPYFRGMLPDPNGLDLLEPERLKKSWTDMVGGIGRHYDFDEDQKGQAKKLLDDAGVWADYWFHNPTNVQGREKYYHDLREAMLVERDPKSMSFQLERAWDARKTLDGEKKTLTAPIVAQGEDLKAAVIGLATSDQKQARLASWEFPWLKSKLPTSAANAYDGWRLRKAEYQGPTTFLDVANVLTMYGLILMGVCLILGFLTPFSALCAAAFLAMIYFSMPPWPGLPDNPKVEGNYFIVSKNLIELIACLLIAATPSAHWVGLDALFFGARRRRRLARREGLIEASDDAEYAADSRKTETARLASRP